MSRHGVPAIVISAPGTNRDRDVALALELAGAAPTIVPLSELTPAVLGEARLAVVAGGFSFADALGSGRLFALEAHARLGDALGEFVDARRPVLGICNGFQALVRAGLLPAGERTATLAHNSHGRFECRWVDLAPVESVCIWTAGLSTRICCPIAHGEGRFLADPETLAALGAAGQIALRYVNASGDSADGRYPSNPNGSSLDIAGICDPSGVVLGLMPHPENHVLDRQNPRFSRGDTRGNCLELFRLGVNYAGELA